ncbi:MAG: hypothetical protein H6721_12350 [Sandaracinus sp.]|nr:hypothetical protein [Sandaracinus sp.]
MIPRRPNLDRATARAASGAIRIVRGLPPRERLDMLDVLHDLVRQGDRQAVTRARRATRIALRAGDETALSAAVDREADALLACARAHDPRACDERALPEIDE